MALSKTFTTGQVLTAADLNTHAVNHVPTPGDPYEDTKPIIFEPGYAPRAGYVPATIRIGRLIIVEGLHIDATVGDWSASTVRFARVHLDHIPPVEQRFLAFRTAYGFAPFGGWIETGTGWVALQIQANSGPIGSHFAVVGAGPWHK